MNTRPPTRWPARVLAIGATLCGVLIVLWSLGGIAFQVWISATPDYTGREGGAVLRAAFVGLIGLALASFGTWRLVRKKETVRTSAREAPPSKVSS